MSGAPAGAACGCRRGCGTTLPPRDAGGSLEADRPRGLSGPLILEEVSIFVGGEKGLHSQRCCGSDTPGGGTHPPVHMTGPFGMTQKGEHTPCTGSGSAQGSRPQGLPGGAGRGLDPYRRKVKGRRHQGGGEGLGGPAQALGTTPGVPRVGGRTPADPTVGAARAVGQSLQDAQQWLDGDHMTCLSTLSPLRVKGTAQDFAVTSSQDTVALESPGSEVRSPRGPPRRSAPTMRTNSRVGVGGGISRVLL